MMGRRARIGIEAVAGGLAAGALAAAPALADIGGGIEPQVSPWRVIAALILCLLLALGGALALKARMQGGGGVPGLKRPANWAEALRALRILVPSPASSARRVRVLETVRLNASVDVALLRFDGEDLLLSASPQGVEILSRGPAPGTEEPTS